MKGRRSNFELLRLISMLMIIAHHFALYNGSATAYALDTAGGMWIQLMRVGGKIGVCIFVMISGYFLTGYTVHRFSKIMRFWLQVLFYSAAIFIVTLIAAPGAEVSFKTVVENIFPLIHDRWWFATTYFILFMLSPFINRMLRSLSAKASLGLIAILFVMLSLVPTVFLKMMRVSELGWFLLPYCLGAHVRLHGMRIFKHKALYWIAATAAYGLNFWLRTVFLKTGIENQTLNDYSSIFTNINGAPVVITALLIFLAFAQLPSFSQKVINIPAQAAFGVYLIHEHPSIRDWLSNNVYRARGLNDAGFIPYTFAAVFGIYLAAAIVELIRIYLLEKNYMKLLVKADEPLHRFLSRVSDKLTARLSDKE